MKKFITYWLPVLVYMVIIFLFSSREKVALTDSYEISFLIFKTIHVLEYALFYLLSYRAFRNTVSAKSHAPFLAFFLLFIFAITDEIHQSFVPTREGRVRDVIIDALGGGTGWILIRYALPKAPKTLRSLAKRWQFN